MPSESLEFLLFSGDYEAVLTRTARQDDPAGTPALIGALALSGRLDEAQSAFRTLVAGGADADAITQARFYLTAGLCHAGQVHKALAIAKDNLAVLRRPATRARFWVWQGLALVRFFEGRFQRARGLARRALASAMESAFPYARVLALDLLAHVLVHTGAVFAGTRLLAQAAALAESLGYAENTATLKTEGVVFQLRFLSAPVRKAIGEAETALAAPSVSYFTRRNGLIELASILALAGEGARARSALDEARRIALPGSDRRGKTRWLIAHALATALTKGREEARPIVLEARAAAGDQLALLAEIGFIELLFVGASDEARAELGRIARATGIFRAQVASALRGGDEIGSPEVEDRICRVLLECRDRSPAERARIVMGGGLHGLVPWALDLAPSRRLILTDTELVTEDEGSITVRPAPSGPSLRLLLALRSGYQSRETLVSSVWGLGRYNPAKHNAVINTAVSRLRLAIGDPSWIVTHDTGYLLKDDVEVVTLDAAAPAVASPTQRPPPGDEERVVAVIERDGPSSSAEVGRALRMSPSTALRLLRRLAEQGRLVRVGGGRSTRYARASS